jgi:hypothetical protein
MAMIDRNFTFATNGTVSAADLHNLIDSATIYQDLITGQVPITSVGTNYELLIADGTNPNAAPNAVTVYDLFDDALSVGTYTGLNLTGALTYGTATGTRLVSTNATITTGTITTGVIPSLTAGTTTSTAATITSGTITNLASTTGTIATLNSTTGTIGNLSTTLAGDFTISQGTGTLGTSGVTLGTYGGATSVPVIAIDAKGRITTASTSAITSGLTGFRNRIINGDMRIDQRNAGASQSILSRAYSIDRFTAQASGATITGQRIADTTGGRLFYYQLNGAASVTQINFEQKIESVNCFDLAGGNITISADISNSLLTTVSFDLYAATTKDSFAGSTLVSSASWTVSPTMQRYSATIAIPSGSSYQNGLWAVFYVGAQTSGTWKIANVQLEAGSTATDFERRPIGTELALCQRYYYKTKAESIGSIMGVGFCQSTTTAIGATTFPTTMRIAPTALEQSGTAGDYRVFITSGIACSSVPVIGSSTGTPFSIATTFNVASGLTANSGCLLSTVNSSAFLAWSAEL